MISLYDTMHCVCTHKCFRIRGENIRFLILVLLLEGSWGGGGERQYLTLRCHLQNECIKTGSEKRQLNVLLTVMVKITRQCSQNHVLWGSVCV